MTNHDLIDILNLIEQYPQLKHDLNFIHIAEQKLIYNTEDDDVIEDYHTYLLIVADVGRMHSATAEQRYKAILRTLNNG